MTQFTEKEREKAFSVVRDTARRGYIVVARAQSTSRDGGNEKRKAVRNKVPVQARGACSSGKLAAADCAEEAAREQVDARARSLKHTQGAGSGEPSRPSARREETRFKEEKHIRAPEDVCCCINGRRMLGRLSTPRPLFV